MASRPDLAASFNSYLRKASKLTCGIDGCDAQLANVDGKIRAHMLDHHADHTQARDVTDLVQECRRRNSDSTKKVHEGYNRRSSDPLEPTTPKPQRVRSSSPPRRSRARRATGDSASDPSFRRGPQAPGKLWSPDDPAPAPGIPSASRTKLPRRGESQARSRPYPHAVTLEESAEDEPEPSTRLIKQPETRPISQEQLVAEVKGIYAGLVMVESKCIEVDNAQTSQSETKLNNEQWQALIALHRTLLHEHHDFFLASQHPSASPALRRLASKYAMPARMWRHGIHSFLELLRHRLPASLEHMLAFIYLAYSMMALLYETVPAFEDTWIECLGDLGRYRMAIEDEDTRDRELWTRPSREWYSKASKKAPTTGRLYHHLSALARPDKPSPSHYIKSLHPFLVSLPSAQENSDPILSHYTTPKRTVLPITVNGKSEYAVPDTGVTANVMTAEMASSLGVAIDRDPAKRHRFKNAAKCSFQALGTASLDLSFDGSSGKTWRCEFAIVEKCAAPITLGKAFLDAAEIFTRFRHRLVKAALNVRGKVGEGLKKAWRLMLMDSPRQKIACHLDGELALATADSGSDIDLVSGLYAQSHGWQVTPLPDDEGYVILANEDIVKVAGYVDADLSLPGKSIRRRFYVLDGLASEVILGDETLEEMQVFCEHAGLFEDVSEDGIVDNFFMIQWVERFDSVEKRVDDILNGYSSLKADEEQAKKGRLRRLFPRKVPAIGAKGMSLPIS